MEAHVKYLLLVYLDESWEKRSLAERQEVYLGQVRVSEELRARGQYLGGNPLHPSVRSRLPSRTRTLVAVDVGCSGLPPRY